MTILQTIRKYEGALLVASRWLVYAMLCIPLIVGNGYFFPFIVPKYIAFRLLVEALFLVYLGLLAANPSRYRPRMTLASWGVLAYVASAILSAIVGVDWHTSFFGTFERMEGVFTTLHYAMLFIALPALFRREDWVKILRWAVGVSVLLSLYGLAQRAGASWTVEAGRDRISSRIGNPAYVGAYLLFQMAFATYLLVRDWAKKLRWLWLGVLAVLLATFVLTLTRGAMLGLFASLPVVGLAWLWLTRKPAEGAVKPNGKLRWAVGVVAALAIVLPVLLVVFKDSGLVQSSSMLRRFADVSTSTRTAQTRFFTWNSAWQGIQERPVLGWGPEQFPVPFNQHFNPGHYQGPNSETWFDHAHNIVLDIWATQGAVGLLAWLVFVVGLFILAWRAARTPATRALGLAGVGVLVAYLLQNLFLFDVLVVWLMLAILGGALASFQPREQQPVEQGSGSSRQGWLVAALAVYALLLVGYALPINYRTNLVSRAIIVSKYYDREAAGIQDQLALFRDVIYRVPLGTGQQEVARQLAASMLTHVQNGHFQGNDALREEALGYTEDMLREAHEAYPYDLQTVLQYAKTIAIRGELKQDPSAYQKALTVIEEARKKSPERIELMQDQGLYLLSMGRTDEAVEVYRRVVELTPGVPFTQWMLGTTLVRLNEVAEGAKLMEDAMQNPEFAEQVYTQNYYLQRLVDLYVKVENWPKLVEVYRRIVTLNPQRAEAWGSLALAYQRLEDYDQAIAAAQEAVRLEPRYQDEAAALIAELEQQKAAAARRR